MTESIYSVDCVRLETTKSIPPTLIIRADGTVSSTGWTNGTLSEYYYELQPLDAVQEYDFVADKPADFATEVMSPISVEYLETHHDWVKAVAIGFVA